MSLGLLPFAALNPLTEGLVSSVLGGTASLSSAAGVGATGTVAAANAAAGGGRSLAGSGSSIGGLLAGGGSLFSGLLGKKQEKQSTGPSFLPPQFLIPQLIFGIIDMIGAQKRNKEARELRDKLIGLQQGSINRVLTAGQSSIPSLTIGGQTFSNPGLNVDRSILGA